MGVNDEKRRDLFLHRPLSSYPVIWAAEMTIKDDFPRETRHLECGGWRGDGSGTSCRTKSEYNLRWRAFKSGRDAYVSSQRGGHARNALAHDFAPGAAHCLECEGVGREAAVLEPQARAAVLIPLALGRGGRGRGGGPPPYLRCAIAARIISKAVSVS